MGTAGVGVVYSFTSWLSNQILDCPRWALDCHVPAKVDTIQSYFGTVQGFVTAIYSIGLAALAFASHSFSESALWPLLHSQSLSIGQIESFLEASRGSIPASPSVLFAARNLNSVFVVLSTIAITLSPLAAAPVIGQVYNKGNVSVEFWSDTRSGGGIGPLYVQSNPPGALRESSAAFYTSWRSNLSSEPMPEYRNWFIDRHTWSERGSFSVKTVRMQHDIDCRGVQVMPEKDKDNPQYFWFQTNMNTNGKTRRSKAQQHDTGVFVRDISRLSMWAQNYMFPSTTKTTVTLIFAAMNGTIDGGLPSRTIPEGLRITNISSIACDITVEFFEDTLVVGSPNSPAVQINSLKLLMGPQSTDSKQRNSTTWNELLLWFAVAPVANGANAYGAQPMYILDKTGWIPERFTSTDGWTIDHIKEFIRVTTGASLQGEVGKWPIGDPIRVPSLAYSVKMDPSRPVYLLVLPSIIIVTGFFLLLWNLRIHHNQNIPIMRKATLDEMLKNSQTADILEAAALDKTDATESSRMEKFRVQFTRSDEGVWGLHSMKAETVRSR